MSARPAGRGHGGISGLRSRPPSRRFRFHGPPAHHGVPPVRGGRQAHRGLRAAPIRMKILFPGSGHCVWLGSNGGSQSARAGSAQAAVPDGTTAGAGVVRPRERRACFIGGPPEVASAFGDPFYRPHLPARRCGEPDGAAMSSSKRRDRRPRNVGATGVLSIGSGRIKESGNRQVAHAHLSGAAMVRSKRTSSSRDGTRAPPPSRQEPFH